ncbi:hypothetical protein [Croceiramulus getboli]|nr:hypothetical protein P8624_14095 [Flavobacteriaceae bacterium YJPT1-3]
MKVHETAYVTCAFRALHEELSGDHFAHLWVSPEITAWMQDYLHKVSAE